MSKQTDWDLVGFLIGIAVIIWIIANILTWGK